MLSKINTNYDQLNEAQREAVFLVEGNALVVSCPGSGKSRILVERIGRLLDLGYKAENILAVTFSRSAADSMKGRLQKIAPDYVDDVTINTFHSVCYRILKTHSTYYQKNNISREFELKKLMIQIVVNELGLEKKSNNVDAPALLSFISYQKTHLLSPDDELIFMPGIPYSMNQMQRIYAMWEKMKHVHKIVSFDDMLFETYKLLSNNASIRRFYQEKYKFIICDETNDLTKIQYELIRIFSLKAKSTMLIGDFSQAIYQFMGASSKYMKSFITDFPDVKVINSNTNYRCQSKVVDLFNNYLAGTEEASYEYYTPAKAFKNAGTNVDLHVFQDGKEEAEWVAKEIDKLVNIDKKYTYGDILILYRTNVQSRPFEEVFINKSIPYHLADGLSFYNRREIKDIVSYLELIHDSNNNEAWDRIANVPNRFFGSVFKDEVAVYAERHKMSLYDAMLSFPRKSEWRYKASIEGFEKVIRRCRSHMGTYKVSTLISIIRDDLGYDDYISKEYGDAVDNHRTDNLNSFQAQANDYKDLGEFLKVIKALSCGDEDKTKNRFATKKDKVEMMTAHKSKGLESKVVFAVGFSKCLFPHYMNTDPESERLLGYVMLSRAEEQMYISSVLTHNDKMTTVSEFLDNCFPADYIKKKIKACEKRNAELILNS